MSWCCAVCRQNITGDALSLFGQYYHNQCFKCTSCSKALAGQKCVNNNEKLFCVECSSPKCSRCSNAVTTNGVKAIGRVWHKYCFNCLQCHDSFEKEGGNFVVLQDEPYCLQCGNRRQSTVVASRPISETDKSGCCRKCRYPLLENQSIYYVLGTGYHENCFNCEFCGDLLIGGKFVEVEKRPACTNCAITKLAQKCQGCSIPIVGQMITVLDNNWHPDCLKCTVCSLVLTNYQKIYKKDNNPICPGCVQSVFNMIVSDSEISPSPPRHPGGLHSSNRNSCTNTNGTPRGTKVNRGANRGSRGSVRGISPHNGNHIRGGDSRRSGRGSPQRTNSSSRGMMNRSSSPNARMTQRPTSKVPGIPSNGPKNIPGEISTPNTASRTRKSIRLTKKEKRKTQLPVRTNRSIDEILSNINYILADDRSVNALLDFMIADYSVENLLFYIDAIQYNEMNLSLHDMKIYSKSIWNKYFIPGGDMEVNVSDSIKRNIQSKLAAPDNLIFVTACGDVVRLIELCTLPRFLKSSQVAKLKAQCASS